ncbi:hypothetical protein DAT35_34845 [Vitiosangium sp. GDMCC 1.1324]|nr:hypothetical protein DAT35_34845 [Vitiosangium sp. GDMCC 1.1324]
MSFQRQASGVPQLHHDFQLAPGPVLRTRQEDALHREQPALAPGSEHRALAAGAQPRLHPVAGHLHAHLGQVLLWRIIHELPHPQVPRHPLPLLLVHGPARSGFAHAHHLPGGAV